MMFGPTQVAASISTRVVESDISEIWPPITPAMPLGPSASHTSAMSELKVRSTPSSVVIFSPSCGAPDDDPAPAHLVEVERVQRLRRGEHHVVRDVHDVRDRPLPRGHQALLQPRRRRPDLHVLEYARREAQADVGVGDLDARVVLGTVVAARLGVAGGRVLGERRGRHRVRVARHAVHPHRIRPVRSDLELEHLVDDRQVLRERGAHRQVLAQDHDPLMVLADPHLVLGKDHSVGLDAAQLRLAER